MCVLPNLQLNDTDMCGLYMTIILACWINVHHRGDGVLYIGANRSIPMSQIDVSKY